MSISQPKLQNPCSKFIEFKADSGVFRFWNKEKKENVEIKLPIKFIVLDELNTIKGFNDKTQSGIYSNEVHSLNHQTLNVRTFKGGASLKGKYAEIKGEIKDMGGKFCKSVYAALINGDELELVNFQLTGAAFSSWMDKEVDVSTQAIVVTGTEDRKKGKVEYKIPVWNGEALTADELEEAIEMDKKLQDFLKSKKLQDAKASEESDREGVQESPEDAAQPDADDDIPF